MSIYLSNYWSLYSEFINVLKDLKYRDIPIALMTNFYQQINDELRSEMEQREFGMKLNDSSIKEQNEIQPFFDKRVAPFKQPLKANLDGKILINLDYTRIPEKRLSEYFSRDHTIILSRSRASEYFGIPNVYVGSFKSDTRHMSEELITMASSILAKNEGHPAFSNPFFSQTFIKRIPGIVDSIETVSNLYDQIPIATILIGTSEDVMSRSLAVVGAMRGIPCICLQHGILMGEEAFMPVFSSHVGVYGEYEKIWFETRGLEEKRIAVIGHPRYDEIFTSTRLLDHTFIEEYDLDPNKITLLLATGPKLDEEKIQTLITELVTNEKIQLIIKPHPWELSKKLISIYTDLEDKYKSVHVIKDRKVDIRDLIIHSDGVIASLSTVALEGFLFNKPVFVYNFIHSNREYDYYNTLENYIQNEPTELIKTVSLYYFSSEKERLNYEDVKNKFLLQSYKTEHSGKELTNLINQLREEEGGNVF